MSDAIISDKNPIVLFGNIGPDVVRLSQIYDPDNDEYVKSNDTYAIITPVRKRYFIRTYADKVVSFTEVSSSSITAESQPAANGWYEINSGHEDQTGKYVPAAKSVVVVDSSSTDWTEASLLLVKTVDDTTTVDETGTVHYPTFKSTLIPVVSGTGGDTATRTLDYGNDRYMLYFTAIGDVDNHYSLQPDRKIALYGSRVYSYKLINSKGEEISTPNPDLAEAAYATGTLIPFVGSPNEITITPDIFAEGTYQNRSFTIYSGKCTKTIQIPVPTVSSSSYLPTLDGWYKDGKNYYLKNSDGSYTRLKPYTGASSWATGDLGFFVNNTVGRIFKAKTVTASTVVAYEEYDVDPLSIQQTADTIFSESYTGFVDMDASSCHVYYPGIAYLRSGKTITSGEIITMQIYESTSDTESRLVMSAEITAKEGSTFDSSSAVNKNISKFDVKFNGQITDTFTISVEDSVSELADKMVAYLTYDNGDVEIVPIDGVTCFCYGLENINTNNAGREFRLLFKYFRNTAGTASANMPRNFLVCYKTVVVQNTASVTVRGISILPVWNPSSDTYIFKFLVYRTTYDQPVIMDNLESVTLTEDTKQNVVAIENGTYKDEGGFIRPTVSPGSTLDYVQHADLNMMVKSDGYSNSIYTQVAAFKLMAWTSNYHSVPTKWLIGSKDSDYEAENLKYGNVSDIRPYFELDPAEYTDEETLATMKPYKMPSLFGVTDPTAKFIRACYTNATPPGPDATGTPTTPTHFSIRAFQFRTYYDWLGSATAIKGVKYYDSSTGEEISVEVGVTNVSSYVVKYQKGLTYCTKNPDGGYVEVEIEESMYDKVISASQRITYYIKNYDEIGAGPFKLTNDDGGWWSGVNHTFQITDAVKSVVAAGGTVPTITGSDNGTQIMGAVVVEFMVLVDGVYKHLYGVPVEVRYPYYPSSDATYKSDTKYYRFVEVSKVTVNGIDYKSGYFKKLVEGTDYNIDDSIPLTPATYVHD